MTTPPRSPPMPHEPISVKSGSFRVFPRKTRRPRRMMTVAYGLESARPFRLWPRRATRFTSAVAFTQDKAIAEQLAEAWRGVAPVKLGGVAYGDNSLEFIPGRYIKPGYTITSRGCPRKCWFCGVWKKWPTVNPMTIHPGWNVLDDNLVAAPENELRRRVAFVLVDTERADRRAAAMMGGEG